MSEWLLIDGYNVINNWREFKNIREENLEHARELLVEYVSEYGVFKGQKVIVVFDAQEIPSGVNDRSEKRSAVEVVFTNEGETADSWIERKTYELVKDGHKIFVVTSDYAEQMMILGAGAYRVSSPELRSNWLKAKKQIDEISEKIASKGRRHEVGNRLSDETFRKLERLRH